MSNKSSQISIMTFNMGLMKTQGIELVDNTDGRYNDIVKFIHNCNIDVVCIQELYGSYQNKFMNDIISSYPNIYQHHYELCGLCIISKYPCTFMKSYVFPYMNQMGVDLLYPNGFINICIDGKMITNSHVSTGGGFPATSFYVEYIRSKQSSFIMYACNCIIENNRDIKYHILCGDFNFSTEQSIKNYNDVIGLGYIDCANDNDSNDKSVTWDKINNPLISRSVIANIFFSTEVSQRCDIIFHKKITPSDKEECVSSDYIIYNSGNYKYLSDHYAVSCVISPSILGSGA